MPLAGWNNPDQRQQPPAPRGKQNTACRAAVPGQWCRHLHHLGTPSRPQAEWRHGAAAFTSSAQVWHAPTSSSGAPPEAKGTRVFIRLHSERDGCSRHKSTPWPGIGRDHLLGRSCCAWSVCRAFLTLRRPGKMAAIYCISQSQEVTEPALSKRTF